MPGKFHLMQVYVAAGLASLLAVLYVAAPADRSALLGGAVMTLIGFVVGKFSNGYARKEASHDMDEEAAGGGPAAR
ncbi:MAG: hypothetical protein GX446_07230 [Chthonomonadales bacterium]|nr:hypothetical protein [Chthonomonadales bacterium]